MIVPSFILKKPSAFAQVKFDFKFRHPGKTLRLENGIDTPQSSSISFEKIGWSSSCRSASWGSSQRWRVVTVLVPSEESFLRRRNQYQWVWQGALYKRIRFCSFENHVWRSRKRMSWCLAKRCRDGWVLDQTRLGWTSCKSCPIVSEDGRWNREMPWEREMAEWKEKECE